MSSVVKTLKDFVNPKNFIESAWLFGCLALFLAFYGPRLHPQLPDAMRKLFNNAVFRGGVMFLVIYLSRRDMAMALTITVIFMVLMNLLQTSKLLSDVNEAFASEKFGNYGLPVSNCNNYNKDYERFGGPIYKMH